MRSSLPPPGLLLLAISVSLQGEIKVLKNFTLIDGTGSGSRKRKRR